MAGTVSFGGIGSGIDTESIINGLISASRAGLSPLKSRSSATKAAVSTISDIGSLLSKLKSAAEALDSEQKVGSYKASSSHDALTATASGTALPGRYSIQVNQLASEQRTYTNGFASTSDALGFSGDLELQVGSGDASTISFDPDDTLSSIAGKINALDSRVSAAVFFDGTQHRLQIRGLDTGAANALTFSGSGATDLGLDVPANTVQQARNAELVIDSFTVTSPTNQVSGAIPGVTLSVNKTNTDPITVSIESDVSALQTKLGEFVSAYNSVVQRIHREAGFGAQKPANSVLAGDSALRAIKNGLGNAMLRNLDGDYGKTFAAVGVRLNNDGTLRLDDKQLAKALQDDPSTVSRILAGTASQDGVMDIMRNVVNGFTTFGGGVIQNKKQVLESRVKSLDDQVVRAEKRLDVQAEILRKQFTQMDQTVSANQATLDYLVRMSFNW